MFSYSKEVKRIPVEAKAIGKAITVAVNNSTKSGALIQACLIACSHHMVENKDASLLTNLYNRLGNSVNKRQIVRWVSAYTSLELREDKAGALKFLGKKKEYTFNLDGEKVAFYDMANAEKNNQPFDLFALVKSLAARATRHSKELAPKGKKLAVALAKLDAEFNADATPAKTGKAKADKPVAAQV